MGHCGGVSGATAMPNKAIGRRRSSGRRRKRLGVMQRAATAAPVSDHPARNTATSSSPIEVLRPGSSEKHLHCAKHRTGLARSLSPTPRQEPWRKHDFAGPQHDCAPLAGRTRALLAMPNKNRNQWRLAARLMTARAVGDWAWRSELSTSEEGRRSGRLKAWSSEGRRIFAARSTPQHITPVWPESLRC